jgi:aarF domain-containing kinase
VIAISQESINSSPGSANEDRWGGQDGLERGPTRSWGFFDMRTVISATSDLFEFILSEEGYRVRVWLVKDIVEAFYIFLDQAAQGSNGDHNSSMGSEKSENIGSQKVRSHNDKI